MGGYNHTDYQPDLGKRLGAGISYLVFASFALVCNVLVAYAMYKHRKVSPYVFFIKILQFFLTYPFYVLMANILIASMGALLICQFVVAIPITFAGRPIYGEGAVMITLSR